MILNTVLQGDCLNLFDKIDDKSIDLVFTSPPYYNAREYSQYKTYDEYLDFIKKVCINIFEKLSDDGYFVLNTSPVIIPREKRSMESKRLPIPFDTFSICQDVGFSYVDDIIWVKPDGASNRGRKFSAHRRPMAYKPFSVTEYLFVMRKQNAPLIDFGIRKHSEEIIEKSLVLDEYERTNVWEIPPARNNGHSAPFPLQLAKNVIKYYSYVDDIVLDPFAGSGTTLVASKMLNRKYIGFELHKEYVDICNLRLTGEK